MAGSGTGERRARNSAAAGLAARSRGPVSLGDRERGDLADVLALDVERLPAGAEHGERRVPREELVEQDGHRRTQVLAVVEHEQDRAPAGERRQGIDGPRPGDDLDPGHGGDVAGDPAGLADRGEVDEPHAAEEPLRDVLGDAQGEPGLPGPDRTGQGHDGARVQQLPDRGPVLLPPHEGRPPARQADPRARDGSRRGLVQGGVVDEDPAVERHEPGAGVDPELGPEHPAGLVEHREGGRLAPGPVEPEHLLLPQSLPERVGLEQRTEVADGPLGLAQPEQGLDAVLREIDVELLEPRPGRSPPVPAREAVVRPATPGAQRAVAGLDGGPEVADGERVRDGGGRGDERAGVDVVVADREAVAAVPAQEQLGGRAGCAVGFEDAPQPPQQRVQRGEGPFRRLRPPDRLDDRRRGHGLADSHQEHPDEGLEAGSAHRAREPVLLDPQWSEVPEPHGESVGGPSTCTSARRRVRAV